MRYFEITSGVRIPVSSEEQSIMDKAAGGDLLKSSLDERDQEVARRMVTRGLLNRTRNSDKNIVFNVDKQKLSRN